MVIFVSSKNTKSTILYWQNLRKDELAIRSEIQKKIVNSVHHESTTNRTLYTLALNPPCSVAVLGVAYIVIMAGSANTHSQCTAMIVLNWCSNRATTITRILLKLDRCAVVPESGGVAERNVLSSNADQTPP
jgi:hypothetical protein